MSWFETAIKTITKIEKELGRDKITPKDIDNAYPFGERKGYPYRQWLKAKKMKLKSLGLIIHKEFELNSGLFEIQNKNN